MGVIAVNQELCLEMAVKCQFNKRRKRRRRFDKRKEGWGKGAVAFPATTCMLLRGRSDKTVYQRSAEWWEPLQWGWHQRLAFQVCSKWTFHHNKELKWQHKTDARKGTVCSFGLHIGHLWCSSQHTKEGPVQWTGIKVPNNTYSTKHCLRIRPEDREEVSLRMPKEQTTEKVSEQ